MVSLDAGSWCSASIAHLPIDCNGPYMRTAKLVEHEAVPQFYL
jgi:hypothetical protein